MRSPRFIRTLYRVQQQVGLTAAEFRAASALAILVALGMLAGAWQRRMPDIDTSSYAREDSIFQAAHQKAQRLAAFDAATEARALLASGSRDYPSAAVRNSPGAPATPAPAVSNSPGAKVDTLDERIELNGATRDELMALPRIGPAMSERIIAFRQQFGPFVVVEDLLMIRGIGDATLERLRPLVRVAAPADTVGVGGG